MAEEPATAVQSPADIEQQKSDYDAWFRQQVEEGIREADDPNTVWVSNEQVMRDLDDIIARHRRHAAKRQNVPGR